MKERSPINCPTAARFLSKMVLGVLLLAAAGAGPVGAGDWPQWRGPAQNSASTETGLPLFWREGVGIAWKVELPGEGASTPAIWGNAVFVTAQQDNKLLLLRLDKSTGKTVWTREVGTSAGTVRQADRGRQKFHQLHNEASPSPTTDGEVVIAHFGNGDLAAYDFAGNQLWKRNLQADHGDYTIWWGHANSPVIYKDFVICVCMQDSLADLQDPPGQSYVAKSYLEAYTRKGGKLRWTTPRVTEAKAEECDSYTTPVLRATPQGDELIVMGGNQLDAYDPATGTQLWWLTGLRGGRTITGPTLVKDALFATRGMRGSLHCIDLRKAAGEIDRRQLIWHEEASTPDSCCPVVWNDLLFFITDSGIATCLSGNNGRLRWRQRLKGSYKASPLAVEGRIYFLNEDGLCTIVSAQLGFNKLAENQLDDQTVASPAVSDGKLFIRGKKYLYCIGR